MSHDKLHPPITFTFFYKRHFTNNCKILDFQHAQHSGIRSLKCDVAVLVFKILYQSYIGKEKRERKKRNNFSDL